MPGRDSLPVGEALLMLDDGCGRVLDEIVYVAGIEKPFAADVFGHRARAVVAFASPSPEPLNFTEPGFGSGLHDDDADQVGAGMSA